MLTPEQKERRAQGIGASEVAPALGLSPYMTPLELYQRKTGELLDDVDSLPMRYGNFIEGFVLNEFRRNHPDLDVVASPDTLQRGPMLAHLDALVPGQCNIQVKTARTRNGWGDSESGDIPIQYILQVQAEMLLANVSVTWVPVLFGGADYDEFVIEADHDLQSTIESSVSDFWQRVIDRDPPDPVTFAEVRKRFGQAPVVGVVEATGTVFGKALTLQNLVAEIKTLEEQADDCRAEIMKALGDKGDTLMHAGNVVATWKLAKAPQRFDSKSFAKEHPELAAQFTHAGEPSRRLLLKEIAA